MFVHFINKRPVAISEQNLFTEKNPRYMDFISIMQQKGFDWSDNHSMQNKKGNYEFTVNQTKLFTTHENFDNKYYDLIQWLSGIDNNRDITKNF